MGLLENKMDTASIFRLNAFLLRQWEVIYNNDRAKAEFLFY